VSDQSRSVSNSTAPLLHRPKAAAKRIGMGETKFWSKINSGEIEARYDGAALVITDDELRRYAATLPIYKPGMRLRLSGKADKSRATLATATS
jgi:hypothetical protein